MTAITRHWFAASLLAVPILPLLAADQVTVVDPISKAYTIASENAQRTFYDSVAAAQKLRNDQIKKATDTANASITQAASVMNDTRKKAASDALAQYDAKSKDLGRQDKIDEAIKVRNDKEKFQKLVTADDERLTAEVADLSGSGPTAKPELRPDEIINPGQVKQQRILITDFLDKYVKAFPTSGNLARDGNASASSINRGLEDPVTALGGSRRHEMFCLTGSKGWWAAAWPKPIAGQYVLIFPRTTHAQNDLWGKASIEINGRAVPVESMGPQVVLLMDLGKITNIRTVKINFDGTNNPGLAGLEIHRDMKK
ncbi:MAG: hypothetical protein FWD61_11095 [Phycisphaerales bacterium]|nr:hypothetical protein [Phycisphaerales bacterium]